MSKPNISRTKSVTTKVTEAEYARLEEQAETSGVNMSEWIRGRLLDGGGRAAAATLLAELLALRAVLTTLLFALANGERVTPEDMRELVARADGNKHRRAAEKLAAGRKSLEAE